METILHEWGMPEVGDEDARLVRDEAFIALAFAQAMLDGAIEHSVSIRALAAIDRQLRGHTVWPRPELRRSTLEKMRAKLVALQ